ncbi:hypothetical protein Vretimale_5591, partial [Volvox reticuliferus]
MYKRVHLYTSSGNNVDPPAVVTLVRRKSDRFMDHGESKLTQASDSKLWVAAARADEPGRMMAPPPPPPPPLSPPRSPRMLSPLPAFLPPPLLSVPPGASPLAGLRIADPGVTNR